MFNKPLPLVVALLALAATATAQDFRVTSSNVAPGTGGITLQDTLFFYFNRALPFNSHYTTKFRWEPRLKAFRRESFLQDPNVGIYVRWIIDHQPATDYAVYVYGVRSSTGREMDRPFTLNYTTAPQHGTRRVEGSAAFGTRSLGKQRVDDPIREMIAQAFSGVYRSEQGPEGEAAAEELRRTVVFLLDEFSIQTSTWKVRAAAALDVAGAFRFDHVRDGVYWPVAINFADGDGEIIGRYGFHDVNGDAYPDPITVLGGHVAGLNVPLFTGESFDDPLVAQRARAVAEQRAAAIAGDQQLLEIEALSPGVDGRASSWNYTFFSPGKDSLTVVSVGPLNTATHVIPREATSASRQPLPASIAGSDVVLQAAGAHGGNAFLGEYGTANVLLEVEAGDLREGPRPIQPGPFWRVRYSVRSGAGSTEELYVLLDIATGAVLTPSATASVRVVLPGPYIAPSGRMETSLRTGGHLPLAQPYQAAPWSYNGNETASSLPEATVDWVLLELRTGTAASTKVATRAALLLADGSIVDTDGVSPVRFGVGPAQYYLVVRHRNHLPVMSAAPVSLTAEGTFYNFTTSAAQGYGTGALRQIFPGVFGLVPGDGNGNGAVNILDRTLWRSQNGAFGYFTGDYNLSGGVNIVDRNLWRTVNGAFSQVPEN